MTAFAEIDPFAAAEKSPAISFKDKPIGTVYTVVVSDSARKVQGNDFVTGEPAKWPDGNPKFSGVINGVDASTGEPCSIWAGIPSDLFAKIAAAQKTLGRSIQAGDNVSIKFTGEEPGKGNPKKVYAVHIKPGTPPVAPAADPFGDDTPPF